MTPPVIFLDVDGVLVTARYGRLHPGRRCCRDARAKHGYAVFDPQCVSALNCLCGATGAQLVISSTWRLFFRGISHLRHVLDEQGVDGEIIGVTPALDSVEAERGDEILQWLEHHPVERYVILDDEDHFWPDSLRARWIQTDFERGLGTTEVLATIRILGAEP